MRRVITHPLTVVVLIIAGLYVLFAHVMDPPLPRSLVIQFMIYCAIGVLLAATFDDATCKRLFEPLRALLGAPGLRPWRMLALTVTVVGASGLAHAWVKPDFKAPVELRTVHPAPPARLEVFGRSYDLVKLENPLRKGAPKGSDAYKALVEEGREIYYRNCFFCHGDHLDGQGHFGPGFVPRPTNFQDLGTIAQLQESYLFWRIATGGGALPREGAPWASAMPAWHDLLKEEEIWKVIVFLYDYTGYEPQSWELGEPGGAAPAEAVPAAPAGPAEEPEDLGEQPVGAGGPDDGDIERVYLKFCAQCHGEEGSGDGPAAEFLYPKPRDFFFAVFKYKTTDADSEFPFDDDLHGITRDGLPGTSMPGWGTVLTKAQIDGLIGLIKRFGEWDQIEQEELALNPVELGARIQSSPESLAAGAKLFKKVCAQCHGEQGRGDVTADKVLKDDWGDRIWPRNLTRPETWRWTRDTEDVFQRLSTGIRGTPMPEHATTMSVEDRWNIANHVMTLRDNAVPLTSGETVVRGVRVDEELPKDPDDPAWERARPITFALVPNVVREPRLFYSLNETVTVRVLFNDEAVAMRLDVDDRSYSVPGHELEKRYRHKDIPPTPDAVAAQFPAQIPVTSEKPRFSHGDPSHAVNIWYWRTESLEPAAPGRVAALDATGPGEPPVPRQGPSDLTGGGAWRHGQWQVVFSRPLVTEDPRDLQFEAGRFIPVAFANWDGWAGQSGGRHSLTGWYWLLLEPAERPLFVYGSSGASGILAGLLFLAAARRQRRRYAEGGAR
jgi:DMSO reductase family type II enzyme heme b subunit